MLGADGHDTWQAERLLSTMIGVLTSMVEHRGGAQGGNGPTACASHATKRS
jgi:hypothetical protein